MSNLLIFPKLQAPVVLKELRACEDEGTELFVDELQRQYTLLLLRRYFRMSIDMGRLPSVLGRHEFFRAKVSSYKVHTFEDAVIFVHDMERSLERLDEMSQRMIAGIVFLEYTRGEIAEALGIYRTTVTNRYEEALSRLTRILLEAKLINPADVQRASKSRSSRDNVREFAPKKPCGREAVQSCSGEGSRLRQGKKVCSPGELQNS